MLEIAILSPLSIKLDGQLLKLPSRRTEALFIYLLRTGKPQAREVLANLLWDDLPQTQAAGNLRVLIANLRKAVGAHIVITRQSIAFDRQHLFRCDLFELEQGMADVEAANQENPDRLAGVLSNYAGELLPGFYLRGGQGFDEWLATEREWLWTRVINTISDLAATYLALGDYRSGIEQSQRLVRFDPLREEGHQLLMRLLASDGQMNAAMAHYQHCVQILDEEMGTPPSPQTTALFEQIQRGQWHTQLPEIQRLAVLPSLNPPALPLSISHNLPRQLTPLVGREKELKQLCDLLRGGSYPLLSLIAQGGCGKTGLTLAVARQLLDDEKQFFTDGIWFVSLAALYRDDENLRSSLVSAIGKALSLPFYGERPIEEQLFSFLKKRHCLLLLDNFEQLIGDETGMANTDNRNNPNHANSAIDFVIDLLQASPQIQLLVTSRIPLDLNSEFVVRLKGLAVPGEAGPEAATHFASVQLFAERANRVAETFDLQKEIDAVATICRFVDGLPLGIELAAAWSGSLSPIEIAITLQANLDFLASKRRDIPPRQRSMRAVFDHSWQLLSPQNQQILAQISIFRDGFTLGAAKAVLVTADPQLNIEHELEQLIRHSLLQQGEDARVYIHDLLREYSTEKLNELEEERSKATVAARHSHFYLALAQQAHTQGWYTRAKLTPLQNDLDNIRQAWQWSSDQTDLEGLERGWLGLWHFYRTFALFQEGESIFQAAATQLQNTAVTEPAQQLLLANLEVARASFLNAIGRHREAVTIAQSSAQIAESVQNLPLQARSNVAIGTGLYRQGQYEVALQRLEKGVVAAHEAATIDETLRVVEANLHKRIANTLQSMGRFQQASNHYEDALALYRQLNHLPGEGEALNGLGWCSQQQHNLQQALVYLLAAEEIQREIGNLHGQSMTLINLAVVYEQMGDYMKSYNYRQQVLQLLGKFDDPYQSVLAHHGLGMLLSRMGDYAAAEPHYRHALELDQAIGDPNGAAWTKNNLGLLYNHREDYATALTLHQEALQTSGELGIRLTQGISWARIGQDHYGLGAYEEAYDAFLKAIAIQREMGHEVWVIESKSGLAATQLALHMEKAARSEVEEILQFLAEHTLYSAREPMLIYWNCYQVLQAVGDSRANQFLKEANHLIDEQAAKILDSNFQRTFLENEPANRALRKEYLHLYG